MYHLSQEQRDRTDELNRRADAARRRRRASLLPNPNASGAGRLLPRRRRKPSHDGFPAVHAVTKLGGDSTPVPNAGRTTPRILPHRDRKTTRDARRDLRTRVHENTAGPRRVS